jgi:hypothetical protein
VYVMPIEQGLGNSEGWADAITLLQAFIDAYLAADNVILTSGTYQASIVNGDENPLVDNGVEVIAYPPPARGVEGYPHYFGFEILMTVKEQWSQT